MLCSKSPSFPLKSCSSRIIVHPSPPPKKSQVVVSHVALKASKRDLKGPPGSRAQGPCLRVSPLTSCFRQPEIKFKSSFSMVMKFYKMLQSWTEMMQPLYFQYNVFLAEGGFQRKAISFIRVSCLSKAVTEYIEPSKSCSSIVWIWFGYLNKYKFDQAFLCMK